MPDGPRPPTVADLEMAMASVAAVAQTVRMIALRFQVEAINQTVPAMLAGQRIAGRLLWEPLGMWSGEGEAD